MCGGGTNVNGSTQYGLKGPSVGGTYEMYRPKPPSAPQASTGGLPNFPTNFPGMPQGMEGLRNWWMNRGTPTPTAGGTSPGGFDLSTQAGVQSAIDHYSAMPGRFPGSEINSRNYPGFNSYVSYLRSLLPGLSGQTPPPGGGSTPPPPAQEPRYWGDLESQWRQYSADPDSFAPGTDMAQARLNFMNAGGYGMTPGTQMQGGWLNLGRNIGGANSTPPYPA